MKYAQTRVDIFKFVRKLKLAKYHLLKTREQPERVGSPTDVANLQISDLRLLRELQELKNETLGTFQHMEDQHEIDAMNLDVYGDVKLPLHVCPLPPNIP